MVDERLLRGDPRMYTMIQSLARWTIAIVSFGPMCAAAQSADPLPPQTQLVAVTGAPAATEETFTIAAVASGSVQPDLVVTFTDLATPAALSAASVVVTQGESIVGTTALAGAAIVSIGTVLGVPPTYPMLLGAAVCIFLRLMAIYFGWRAPVARWSDDGEHE